MERNGARCGRVKCERERNDRRRKHGRMELRNRKMIIRYYALPPRTFSSISSNEIPLNASTNLRLQLVQRFPYLHIPSSLAIIFNTETKIRCFYAGNTTIIHKRRGWHFKSVAINKRDKSLQSIFHRRAILSNAAFRATLH